MWLLGMPEVEEGRPGTEIESGDADAYDRATHAKMIEKGCTSSHPNPGGVVSRRVPSPHRGAVRAARRQGREDSRPARRKGGGWLKKKELLQRIDVKRQGPLLSALLQQQPAAWCGPRQSREAAIEPRGDGT
jgi:hypothetical protein